MPDVAIRPARPEDAPLIHTLIGELAAYERLSHEAVATLGDVQAALFGPAPRAFCEIAEMGDEAVGFALWFYSFSTFRGRHGIYLEDLFVRPAARGSGLGRALLAGPRTAVPRRGLGAAGMVGARLERACARLLPPHRRRAHGGLGPSTG